MIILGGVAGYRALWPAPPRLQRSSRAGDIEVGELSERQRLTSDDDPAENVRGACAVSDDGGRADLDSGISVKQGRILQNSRRGWQVVLWPSLDGLHRPIFQRFASFGIGAVKPCII